jgi:pimeloyl-[acyl-carrier protein] methyl ester esterase
MSSAVFQSLMRPLAASFRILAPDLRGHGRSDPGPGYQLKHLASDVEEWLGTVDAKEICLLGWSLGGLVALELVERLGVRVHKLVLMSTTPCFVQREAWLAGQPAAQVKVLARQFKRDPLKTVESFFMQQFDGEDLDDVTLQAHKREILDACPVPGKEAALGGLDTLLNADLTGCTWQRVPSLVLHGECDTIIPPSAGRYLAQHLPDAQYVQLDKIGHAPLISQPDYCARVIKDFLT